MHKESRSDITLLLEEEMDQLRFLIKENNSNTTKLFDEIKELKVMLQNNLNIDLKTTKEVASNTSDQVKISYKWW